MQAVRKFMVGAAWAGVLALAAGADSASAADKQFPLPGGDHLVMRWNAGWVDAELPSGAPRGTILFQAADKTRMSASIVPMPPNPLFTGDVGNLRILTRNVARALEELPAEVDHEQLPLEGANIRGFYVKGRDPKPKPGEYTFIYIGAVSINSRPYLIEVNWNAGNDALAQSVIAAFKTARIR